MKQLFVAVSICVFLACSKPGNDDQGPGPGNPGPTTVLTITTVTPNSAEFVPVTINGTGFSTTPDQNTVWVDGKPATVTKASATQLEITLPANLNAGDHDIMVTVNFKTVTKTKAFHLIGWVITDFAGTGAFGHDDHATDPRLATFRQPTCIAMDKTGNIYVGDQGRIRKITPQGQVSTLAGGAPAPALDGTGSGARFGFITSIAIDDNNNLYVADQVFHLIRKVSPAGVVNTLAGKAEEFGNTNGAGSAARFFMPYGVTVNKSGTALYIGDHANHLIRKIDLSNNMVSTVAGNGTSTRKDDNGLNAGIPSPGNLAFDADDNLVITEKGAGRVRRMAPNGTVTTVGGFDTRQDVNESPTHLAFDRDKNIYVTFSGLGKVKKYNTAGVVSDFAGANTGPQEDNGPANAVLLLRPEGILLVEDAQGNKQFYVVDNVRKKIKKIVKQ